MRNTSINTNIKNSILKLIDLKNKTSEIIQSIYLESQDIQICLYNDNSIFCENPFGFETLAKIFKKRIITCNNKVKGKYSVKKYFVYKDIEFFCLYKLQKEKNLKIQRIAEIIGKALSVLKNIALFVFSVFKAITK